MMSSSFNSSRKHISKIEIDIMNNYKIPSLRKFQIVLQSIKGIRNVSLVSNYQTPIFIHVQKIEVLLNGIDKQ